MGGRGCTCNVRMRAACEHGRYAGRGARADMRDVRDVGCMGARDVRAGGAWAAWAHGGGTGETWTASETPRRRDAAPVRREPLEPVPLSVHVGAFEIGLGFHQVDNALDNRDNAHNACGDSEGDDAAEHRNGKHDESGLVVAEVELMDAERAEEDG